FLSLLTNVLFNTTLSDMETGYKAFRSEVLRSLDLREDRFGIEPEITGKVCKLKLRIYELPISYYGRSYEEGKKITWRDGFRAVWVLLRGGLAAGRERLEAVGRGRGRALPRRVPARVRRPAQPLPAGGHVRVREVRPRARPRRARPVPRLLRRVPARLGAGLRAPGADLGRPLRPRLQAPDGRVRGRLRRVLGVGPLAAAP